MNWLNKIGFRKWLRILHRDIGYLVVGITMVYAISGIILNHKKKNVDPAYKTISVVQQIEAGLSVDGFTFYFKENYMDHQLTRIIPDNSYYRLFIKGGVGSYKIETGLLEFEVYRKKPLVHFLNKLHYNQKKYWTAPADIFAGVLIFLALSGIFMVRGKKGLSGSGKWYLIAGIALVFIYIWL
jgi:uncharacterized protein